MSIEITSVIVGVAPLDARLKRLAALHPAQGARALNRTAARAATRSRREVSKAHRLPLKEIKGRIRVYNASPKKLVATLWGGIGRPFYLVELAGAFFNLASGELRGRGHKVKAFRARMKSGRQGLYVRKPNSSHYKGGKLRKRDDGQNTELPIEEPAIRLDPTRIRAAFVGHANEQMRAFFPRELKRLINLAATRRSKRGRR